MAGAARQQLGGGGLPARLDLWHLGVRQHSRHPAGPRLHWPVVALNLHGSLLCWKSHRKYSLRTNSGQVFVNVSCNQLLKSVILLQIRTKVCFLRHSLHGHQFEHRNRLLPQLHRVHRAEDSQRPHLPRPLPDPLHPLSGGDGAGLQDRGGHDDLHVLRGGADDPGWPLLLLQLLVRAGAGYLPPLHPPLLLLVIMLSRRN